MSLNPDQFAFSQDIGRLIAWVYNHPGWTITCGEMWRPPQMAELYAQSGMGIRDSLHINRLAFDLLLFIDGEYKLDIASYAPLGDFWESLSAQNTWGGKWKNGDANHFQRNPVNKP